MNDKRKALEVEIRWFVNYVFDFFGFDKYGNNVSSGIFNSASYVVKDLMESFKDISKNKAKAVETLIVYLIEAMSKFDYFNPVLITKYRLAISENLFKIENLLETSQTIKDIESWDLEKAMNVKKDTSLEPKISNVSKDTIFFYNIINERILELQTTKIKIEIENLEKRVNNAKNKQESYKILFDELSIVVNQKEKNLTNEHLYMNQLLKQKKEIEKRNDDMDLLISQEKEKNTNFQMRINLITEEVSHKESLLISQKEYLSELEIKKKELESKLKSEGDKRYYILQDISKAETEHNKLSIEVKNLEQNNEAMEEIKSSYLLDREVILKKIENTEKENIEVKQLYEQIKEKNEKFEEFIQIEFNATWSEIDKLKNLFGNFNVEVSNNKVKDLIKNTQSFLNHAGRHTVKLIRDFNDVKSQYIEVKSDNATLKKGIQAYEDDIVNLNLQLKSSNDEKDVLEKEKKTLENIVNINNEYKDEVEDSINALEKYIRKNDSSFSIEKNQSIYNKMVDVQKYIYVNNIVLINMKSESVKYQNEIKILFQTLETTRKEIESNSLSIKQLTRENDTLHSFKSQLNKKVDELESINFELNLEVDKLRSDVLTTDLKKDSILLSLNETKMKLETLNNEIYKLQEEKISLNEKLTENLEEIKKISTENTKLKSTIEDVRSSSSIISEELKLYLEALEEISLLVEFGDPIILKNDQKIVENSIIKNNLDKLNFKIKKWNGELKSNIDNLNNDITVLNIKNGELKFEIEQLTRQNKKMEKQETELQKKLFAIDNEKKELVEAKDLLKLGIEIKKEDVFKLENEIHNLKQQITSLDLNFVVMKTEKLSVSNIIENLKTSSIGLVNAIVGLEDSKKGEIVKIFEQVKFNLSQCILSVEEFKTKEEKCDFLYSRCINDWLRNEKEVEILNDKNKVLQELLHQKGIYKTQISMMGSKRSRVLNVKQNGINKIRVLNKFGNKNFEIVKVDQNVFDDYWSTPANVLTVYGKYDKDIEIYKN